MKKRKALCISILLVSLLLAGCHKNVSQLVKPGAGDTIAEIEVEDYGTIYVRFFKNEAPKAVENFITLAKKGFYNGQSFYRIIDGSLIESGDPSKTGTGGKSIWGKYFEDEFDADLQPYYGALCMSNSGKNTNNSEFFIVQSKKTFQREVLKQIEEKYEIKFNDKAIKLYGTVGGSPWFYERNTVFGQVYDGNHVLEKIAKVDKSNEELGIPKTDVVIKKINITKYKH